MAQFGCGDKNYLLFLFVLILVAQSSFSLGNHRFNLIDPHMRILIYDYSLTQGHIISIVSSSVNVAISLAAAAIAFQMLFSGFFLKKA